MGKLAQYGALAGAGQGLQELSKNEREERLSDVEYQRQQRIAEWQADRQDKRQESQQDFTLNLNEKQNEFSAGESEKGREFTGSENQLNRESAEKIAGINALGRSGNTPEWAKDRYEHTKQSVKNDFGETIDETMAVYDRKDGVTYLLKDGVWQLPNSEIKIPQEKTSPDALKRLADNYRKNPSESYNFLQVHGWLPIWIFSGQQSTIGKD